MNGAAACFGLGLLPTAIAGGLSGAAGNSVEQSLNGKPWDWSSALDAAIMGSVLANLPHKLSGFKRKKPTGMFIPMFILYRNETFHATVARLLTIRKLLTFSDHRYLSQ